MENCYFWGKSWHFNEKIAKKMENLRYVLISSLYIAVLLSFRSLRYYLSTKNCSQKSTLWKMVIFGVKVGILMKNHKKMENLSYIIVSSLYIVIYYY